MQSDEVPEVIAAEDPIPETALARRWNKSIRTIQRWRRDRYGPAYLRIGGSIFYRMDDVLAFEDSVRTEAVDE